MILPNDKLYVIAGPCVIEDLDLLKKVCEHMVKLTEKLGIHYVFKSSFDKANRTSIHSFRGPGLDEGLKMLATIKQEFGVPVLSDVHTPDQVSATSEVLDIVQIPAFLARQTDFLVEAGKAKVAVNVKKGQFMSPYEMETTAKKFKESGGEELTITERGTTFGYGNLVVDFRSLPIIKSMGLKYTFDATHSVQLPAARAGASGGQRQFVTTLMRAQLAAGADGLFMEVHPNVAEAKSDKETQVPLDMAEAFLTEAKKYYEFAKENRNQELDKALGLESIEI